MVSAAVEEHRNMDNVIQFGAIGQDEDRIPETEILYMKCLFTYSVYADIVLFAYSTKPNLRLRVGK